MDSLTPRVDSLAIADGKILPTEGADTSGFEVLDLGGAVIVPGFVDCHIHWQWTALSFQELNLNFITTKREAMERIADAARKLGPGDWLRGSGWAQGDWTDSGGAFPTAADLDAIAPENPVVLKARSGHATWINSAAMRIANVTKDTGDPPGGTIQRDANGNPTGILFEEAYELVTPYVPKPTLDEIADAMVRAQQHAWKWGLTGVHDFDGPPAMEAMQTLRERGQLGVRVVKNINDPYIHHAHELGLRSGFGDEWIRLGSLKMFADGALGSVTPLMIEPINGQPDNYGIRIMDKSRMEELAIEATRRGFSSAIHAIGDLAVRDVLDVFERVRAEEAKLGIARSTRRHRIEHVQLVHPNDQHRLAELDIIASMQPMHGTSDMEMADRYWGERARHGYNPRVQIDHGARVVFGTDAPVEPVEPLKTIHAAVTRRRADGSPGPEGWYPDARVSVEEAIRAYTTQAAYAAGLENVLGKLVPGYLADLVVLAEDPFKVDSHEIKDIPVLGTMIGGEWKWRTF